MSSDLTITIDGARLRIARGTTILDAAGRLGIEIPTLCHEPSLKPQAECRICLVEIEGRPRLEPACATEVDEGMVVRTDTARVAGMRRMVLEMLMSRHPGNCSTKVHGGECRLCDYAERYGVRSPVFGCGTAQAEIIENDFVSRSHSECMLCSKCVRVCNEVQGVGALAVTGRGYGNEVRPSPGKVLAQTDCEMCGNCVEVCPTGAIRARNVQDLSHATRVRTTCGFCGVGCQLDLNVVGGRVVAVTTKGDNPVNGRWLCVKGRFGHGFIHHSERLTRPMVRRGGVLEPVSWDEALDYVSARLGQIKADFGPDAIAFLSSARCTTEENYLVQKLTRAAIGTNNVDQCARTCHAPTVAGLATALGSGAMTNSLSEIPDADVLFAIGANPTEAHPIVGLRIKEAVRRGARLIVADPRKIWLTRIAWLHLQIQPGTDLALLNAMAHVILSEGLADEEFARTRTEGFDEFRRVVETWTPARAAEVCGVPAEDISRAAREYARSAKGAIFYTLGITEHTCGTRNVLGLANLALLTGHIGKRSSGINPLRGQNNVQGACDMGAQPDVYPGYQKVTSEESRRVFEKAWGVSLPPQPGMTIVDMIDAAADGMLKAMYIVGEDPVMSEAHSSYVSAALEKLDLLVVQDIFMSETAKMADVVLPASCFAEKDGTFTNTERRVQRVRKAVDPPGEAREDWRILMELSTRLGYRMDYDSPEEIWREISSLVPMMSGISYQRIDRVGLQWPCPDPNHPGTEFLHAERFTRGLGKFHAVEHSPPRESPDDDYPWMLSTGRTLHHYNTGSMTRRVAGIAQASPDCFVEINPEDLRRIGADHGSMLRVTTRRGSVAARAVATSNVKPGRLWMPFHFAEVPVNQLTIDAFDEITKTAEFKVSAARVEVEPT